MVRSMVVLVALLGVVVLYQRFYNAGTDNFVAPVQVGPSLVQARDAAQFDVVAPVGLPEGWRANSVRYEPGRSPRWHVGYLTPAGEYAGIEQESVTPRELAADAVPAAARSGAIQIEGRTWQVWIDAERGETALVRGGGDAAVLVTGSADPAELVRLAAALRGGDRPAGGPGG